MVFNVVIDLVSTSFSWSLFALKIVFPKLNSSFFMNVHKSNLPLFYFAFCCSFVFRHLTNRRMAKCQIGMCVSQIKDKYSVVSFVFFFLFPWNEWIEIKMWKEKKKTKLKHISHQQIQENKKTKKCVHSTLYCVFFLYI